MDPLGQWAATGPSGPFLGCIDFIPSGGLGFGNASRFAAEDLRMDALGDRIDASPHCRLALGGRLVVLDQFPQKASA